MTAFDSDDLIVNELGDNMSDLVKKTREIEDWPKKRKDIYRELVSQGDVFVQELKVDEFREMPLEDVQWNPNVDKISSYKFKSRLKKIFSDCQSRMISGDKVYVGNKRIQYVEDQDMVFILNIESRAKMYSRYAKWERWENVPNVTDTLEFDEGSAGVYRNWNLVDLNGKSQIAEIFGYNQKTNRFQIFLNGVPMLPHNYFLTNISPSGTIPLAQGKLEPISNFWLSKSQPSKIKVDQEVYDEVQKLMIEGMRQGRKPPYGNKGKKVLSPNILIAGTMTPDMKENDIFPLMKDAGLSNADFSYAKFIKEAIDEKSVNDAFEGTDPGGDVTATQIKQEVRQQMVKLGLHLDGVVNLERRMTWLRTYNIIYNLTKKFDADMDSVREGIFGEYRKFSVDTTLSNGERGIKMFRFTDGEFPDVGEQQREERDLSKKNGKEVRIIYMNPEVIRAMKYIWFIIITPTPSSNDELSQLLFIQNLEKAIEIFGPESMNMDYLKQRFSILINEDYNKFFKKEDILKLLQQGLAKQGQGEGQGQNETKITPARAAKKQPLRPAIR